MSYVIIDSIGQELTPTFESRVQAFAVQTAMQRKNRRPYWVVVALSAQMAGHRAKES